MYARVARRVPVDADRWAAWQAFQDDPAGWLPLPAQPDAAGRWRATVRLGPARWPVTVTLGEPWSLPDTFSRSLHWSPERLPVGGRDVSRALPAFHGRIGVRQLEDGCQVQMWGYYVPPARGLGAGIDRLVLRLAARATLGRFASEVAGRLRTTAAPSIPRGHGADR